MYSKSPIFDHTDNIIYNTTILTKMFVLSMILQPFSDVFEAGDEFIYFIEKNSDDGFPSSGTTRLISNE